MKQKRGKSKGYPWNEWFAKRAFKLVEGKDFNCLPHSMIVQIRNAASSRGKSVVVRPINKGKRTTLNVTIRRAA